MTKAPILYFYDTQGFYTSKGEAQAHPVKPDVYFTDVLGATLVAVPNNAEPDEFASQWQGYRFDAASKTWSVQPDNREREGYLKAGEWVKLKTPELPEEWYGDEMPEPELTEEQKTEQRKYEIASTLREIDIDSVRPLRAIADGTATDFDTAKLTSLEAQAAALRLELESLQA